MIYIAKHFVKIAGRKYTPGEIITSAIPDDKLQRLLRLKAIEGQEADVGGPEASGALDCPTADAGTHGSEDALHDSKSDDEAEITEAPVIDAMDGIVPAVAQKQPVARPARTKKPNNGGRKKA